MTKLSGSKRTSFLALRLFFAVDVALVCLCVSSAEVRADTSGEAMLIVYPDYPINTDTFYGYTELVGHAGVLLIDESGLTKYYEFGRYDSEQKGTVRRITIPNVEVKDGRATKASLTKVLKSLSNKSGKSGRVRGAYFINMSFDVMKKFAEHAQNASNPSHGEYDPKRKPYAIGAYNCGHFAEQVILKGHPKVDRPTVINPTPNNFADEYIEEGNAEVIYTPGSGSLTIGVGDESDAKE